MKLIIIFITITLLMGAGCKENDVNYDKQWGYELNEPVVKRPVEPGGAPVVPEPMSLLLLSTGLVFGF